MIKDNKLECRSNRNDWAMLIEDIIIEKAPKPISYDVDSTQPVNFTEYSYTEYLGGIMINTQSIDINARGLQLSSEIDSEYDNTENLKKVMKDKYILESINNEEYPKHVCFFAGQNMFDIMSKEIISRLAFENDEFYVKLHPLTDDIQSGNISRIVGWDKIINPKLSGFELLKNCEVAYTSTASELCSAAVIYGKKVVNVSDFFTESIGIYYPINRILTIDGINSKKMLNNMINDKSSGLLFPWMEDIEERIDLYFKRTLELREIYKPLYVKSTLNKTPIDKEQKNVIR